MEMDPPRARLIELIEERGTDLATVSKAIPRNHAYLQQYLARRSPQHLPEQVRERLGAYFGVDPDEFRSGPRSDQSEWNGLYKIVPEGKREEFVAVVDQLARLLSAAPVASSQPEIPPDPAPEQPGQRMQTHAKVGYESAKLRYGSRRRAAKKGP